MAEPSVVPQPETPRPEPCENGWHPVSVKDGPYRWKCKTCGEVWYGPNY